MTSSIKVWSLQATLLWGLVIAGVFLGAQTIVASVYVHIASAGLSPAERQLHYDQLIRDGDLLALVTIVSGLISGLLTVFITARKAGSQWRHYLGLYAVCGRQLLKWCLGFVALLLALELVTLFLERSIAPDFMTEVYESADSKLLLFVAVVVAASAFEEVFFRGFLLEGLRHSALGSAGGVIVTAALWSVVHVQYDVFGMASIFCIGLLLGMAKVKTGSIWLPIVLHAMNNALAFFVLVYLSR